MKVLYVLCVIALIAVVFGGNHHAAHVSNDICKYTNHKGEQFNLHLLANHYSTLQYYDEHNTKSTVYFQPCGTISSFDCGANSSVCVVPTTLKGVSFGSTNNVQRADVNMISATSTGRSGSVEYMFGDGEMCNNGLKRKAIVTYICNMELSDSAYSYPKISATIEECSVSVTVETPFACPVANYCASIRDDEKCSSQSGICAWSFGRCRSSSGCFAFTETSAGILSFIIVTITGLFLICVCGICICACRKGRKRNCARKTVCKRSTKGKKRSASKPKPEANFDSFAMPYQLVPGGAAPINPYSNVQGYYMTTQGEDANL